MEGPHSTPISLSPHDETLDAPAHLREGRGTLLPNAPIAVPSTGKEEGVFTRLAGWLSRLTRSGGDHRQSGSQLALALARGANPAIHLVEGSGPQLSSETATMLQCRLRIAAMVLGGGLLAYFPWAVWAGWASRDGFTATTIFLLAFHLVVTLVLLFEAGLLCRNCPVTSRTLRFRELIVFGGPALFFTVQQFAFMKANAELHSQIVRSEPPWMMLMFTYAMFIPNTWRRAAAVLGSMAAAPVLLTFIIWWKYDHCSFFGTTGMEFAEAFTQIALIMSIAAVASVMGVHTIGALRSEMFRAKQLGQYHLRHLLGAGGMGEVYLAEHLLMKRPCAIKIIRPEKAGDPRVLARFEREVRATAKLSHWNSIDIFDYGRTDDGTFYYVMEYLPGLNLNEIVNRFGPMPVERVVYLLRQTCDALAEAHAAGLVHRDIKPANIFAAHRGGMYDVAKLLDFGLAKPAANLEENQLTQDGMITGSPLYMSPEQALGDSDADARSDIYALGTVAYFLLTGRPPFDDNKPLKVLMAHAHERPAPISDYTDGVPDDVEQIVMRCLEKDPEHRFQEAADLRDALDHCSVAGLWNSDVAGRWWTEHGAEEVASPLPLAV